MQWYDLPFYLLAFAVAIAITVYIRMIWRLTYGTRVSASRWIEPLPPLLPEIMDVDAELRALGFHYVMATEIEMRVLPQPVNEWFYLSSDPRIYVEISYLAAQALPFIAFFSWFADDASITTTKPLGETIVTHPKLHFRYARYSLKAAFDDHITQLEKWQTVHGEAVHFTTTDQLMEYSPRFNRLYKTTYNRRQLRLAITNIACFFVIGVLFVLANRWLNRLIAQPQQTSASLVMTVIFGLILVMVFIRQYIILMDD